MALNDVQVGYPGTTPGASLAAPTTSESVANPDDRTYLLVVIGGTATTVGITGQGNTAYGVANPSYSSGALTNTTRLIKVDRQYQSASTGNAAVTFSQVTAVTACVVRFT